MSDFQIRPLNTEDKNWISKLITERWGAEFIVVHGQTYYPSDLPGFAALKDNEKAGLITYCVMNKSYEIVTLDSLKPSLGIGTALIEAVKDAARKAGCKRVWVITTNDNLNALCFYQKRGFALVAVHRNAVDSARKHKSIPLTGADGIPIRDEIELELMIEG
jgi:N-acetylglutamate synthase-like GNAT family acetyltransferase